MAVVAAAAAGWQVEVSTPFDGGTVSMFYFGLTKRLFNNELPVRLNIELLLFSH